MPKACTTLIPATVSWARPARLPTLRCPCPATFFSLRPMRDSGTAARGTAPKAMSERRQSRTKQRTRSTTTCIESRR